MLKHQKDFKGTAADVMRLLNAMAEEGVEDEWLYTRAIQNALFRVWLAGYNQGFMDSTTPHNLVKRP